MPNAQSSYINKIIKKENKSQGYLYIIPTPIGNLSDITLRALSILQHVDLIAAENVRHTSFLLQNYSINTHLLSLYDYNEKKKSKMLLEILKRGKNIALVSNAGTPVINDPGYHLIHICHKAGIRVVPLPGSCAAITALSAAGLPSDRFCYEGFLPSKLKKRHDLLRNIKTEKRTIIFYESTHRVIESLHDMVFILGFSRYVVLARELTKFWETIYGAPVGKLLEWIKEDGNRCKGEIVLIVEGYKEEKNEISIDAIRTFKILKSELPLNKVVSITAKIHGIKKNMLYKFMLKQKIDEDNF